MPRPYLVELHDDDQSTPNVVYAHDPADALSLFGDALSGWTGVTVRELDDDAFREFLDAHTSRPELARRF